MSEDEQKYPEPTVGALIIAPTGQLLFVQSPKWGDLWTLPGGHVEVGELAEEAIVREVKEETGLDVMPVEMLLVQQAIFPIEFHKRKHFLFFDYLCVTQNPQVELDGLELQKHVWMNPNEALELNLSLFSRNVLTEYLARTS